MNTFSGLGRKLRRPEYELAGFHPTVTLSNTIRQMIGEPLVWTPLLGILLLTAALAYLAQKAGENHQKAVQAKLWRKRL